MNQFEYLSGEYNRGYRDAIVDITDVVMYIQIDLKRHNKRLTPALTERLLSCCLTNRERLRESVGGFIRWNKQKEDFEYYEPARDK